jgi:hypothetical protein
VSSHFAITHFAISRVAISRFAIFHSPVKFPFRRFLFRQFPIPPFSHPNLPVSHFANILFCFNPLHKMDHSILEKRVISGPLFIDLLDFGWGLSPLSFPSILDQLQLVPSGGDSGPRFIRT